MSEIVKGSSVPVESLKINTTLGVAVDLSTLTKLIVYCSSEKYKTVLLKLSKAVTAGYQLITLSDNYTVAPFVIPGSITKLMDTGYMRISVYGSETDAGVMIDGKEVYMGSVLLKDTDGTNIKFIDDPINAEN